jgi:hypothetical protein
VINFFDEEEEEEGAGAAEEATVEDEEAEEVAEEEVGADGTAPGFNEATEAFVFVDEELVADFAEATTVFEAARAAEALAAGSMED